MRVLFANILAIYRRELQSYFTAPFYYVIAGVFWLLSGLFFLVVMTTIINQVAQQDLLQQQFGAPSQAVDVPKLILESFLGLLGSISQVILPMLSMGLYTEERKRGTLELLATSPITNWCVATGKLLAVLTFYTTLLLPVGVYQFVALRQSTPPLSPWLILAGNGGLILLAAAILSLGMFLSSLTDSTILAAILGFAVLLILWVLDVLAKHTGGHLSDLLTYLSPLEHFTHLTRGIFRTSSLVVFGSYIFLGIFLTAQSIDAFRYQRN
ncbi:ABC transporter permease subunit [uncultured Thermosynechococcus sp.]|uniref:ABC transporter permease n=1 Tax=uncultured Thermosynechococcus sp. TaxID=436945 RepID=UPI00345A7F2A